MKLKNKIILGVTALMAVTSISFFTGNSTYATVEAKKTSTNGIKAEISYYDSLISSKKNILISVNNKEKTQITKEELINMYTSNKITDVKNKDGESLANTDKVKTQDVAVTENGEFTIILAGDSNKDGIICDTDDIMTIIDDYLGKKVMTDEEKIAANLTNSDTVLDTDDIMQMINKYLGKIEKMIKQPQSVESNVTVKTVLQTVGKVNLANSITSSDYGKDVNYSVTLPTSASPVSDTTSAGSPSLGAGETVIDDWKIFYNDGTNVYIIKSENLKDYECYGAIAEEMKSSRYNNYIFESSYHPGIASCCSTPTSLWNLLKNDSNWDYLAGGMVGATAQGGSTYSMLRDSCNEYFATELLPLNLPRYQR